MNWPAFYASMRSYIAYTRSRTDIGDDKRAWLEDLALDLMDDAWAHLSDEERAREDAK